MVKPTGLLFGPSIITPATFGYWILTLEDVLDMVRSPPYLARVCLYIYIYFSVMGPPWAFQGCHVSPTDWTTSHPLIVPHDC